MRGKEGFSLGTCGARALQASHPWVARTLRLYNYLLRFHLTISKQVLLSFKNICTKCPHKKLNSKFIGPFQILKRVGQ